MTRIATVIDIHTPQLILEPAELPNLAPDIHRQRLVIEGLVDQTITESQVTTYLSELSAVLDMTTIMAPTTHRSDTYGWAGWIHWETSGAHFYAWEQPHRFFSVDIYTCKEFNPLDALDFTAQFFDATQCVAKGF